MSFIKFTHSKRKSQLIITVSWPKSVVYRRFKRKFSKWLRVHRQAIDDGVTAGFLVVAAAGLVYSITLLNPPSYVAQASVVATAELEPEQEPAGMTRSTPVKLKIPAIDLQTDLIEVGRNTDDTLEVPERYDVAGWYKHGPSPGEVGPAVIAGHVDSYMGAAVFYRLEELELGDKIEVLRKDGQVAHFVVDKVALFSQDDFPSKQVYGDIDHPGLRLITCGGSFNQFTGEYTHNTVVYASKQE